MEEKHEQERRVTEDTKMKMQEQLLVKVHEKEVKMAVNEEQQRLTTQLSEAEIKRRIAISDSLIAVHKELLSKREATKATDPLQTQQVLEEAKLRMQEEMERRTNAKEADAAMDQEKIRRVSSSQEPEKEFDERNTKVKEELVRKASIKEAVKAQEQAREEYSHQEKRSQAQEQAIRQANQKMADRLADEEQKERIESSKDKPAPHLDEKLKAQISQAAN